ncbi:response regulator transcription factor [Parasulfitobacter algicola]|uniref:Response regulator transcription factor n=1 Tax=Parasulfitobacter algicola TaxID=2614809 RepID=A0ABX2IWW3_9RHOB|nr:response regulator transcription factor [Sulfitobacter algicola]NSX55660.1 response regulator transcription factor [Sulfitobacter algicola]
MNVLLVEDEAAVGDFIRRGLGAEAWSVQHVLDAEAALDTLKADTFDVLIFDVMLPGMSGVDLCRTLRARKIKTPILMLTAMDAVDDCVIGLRAGADDYLTKPFDFNELVARIEALARRQDNQSGAMVTDDKIRHGLIVFDKASHVVTVEDQEVDLTVKERELLVFFMSNVNKLVSRERILNTVWGSQEDPYTNIVDVYVARLRKKIAGESKRIKTVRGIGYRFSDADMPETAVS